MPLTFLLSILGTAVVTAVTPETDGTAGTVGIVDSTVADCWCLVGGLATTTTGFCMVQVAEVRALAPPTPGTALIGAVATGEDVPIPQLVVTAAVVSSGVAPSTRLSIFSCQLHFSFFPPREDRTEALPPAIPTHCTRAIMFAAFESIDERMHLYCHCIFDIIDTGGWSRVIVSENRLNESDDCISTSSTNEWNRWKSMKRAIERSKCSKRKINNEAKEAFSIRVREVRKQ